MKYRWVKTLAIVLAASMTMSSVPASVLAADDMVTEQIAVQAEEPEQSEAPEEAPAEVEEVPEEPLQDPAESEIENEDVNLPDTEQMEVTETVETEGETVENTDCADSMDDTSAPQETVQTELVDAETALQVETETDQIPYTITANNTGMFNVVDAYLVENASGNLLYLTLNGTGYRELFKGTYEEAIATGGDSSKWIIGQARTDGKGFDGKYQFAVPVKKGETYIQIQALSNNHKVDGWWWYPRYILIDQNSHTLQSGDYQEKIPLSVNNGVKSMKASNASIYVVGGPHSNGYQVTGSFAMDGFSKAYMGGKEKAEAATTGVILPENGIFTMDVEKIVGAGNGASIDTIMNKDTLMSFYSDSQQKWMECLVNISKTGKTMTVKNPDGTMDTGNGIVLAKGTYKGTATTGALMFRVTDVLLEADGKGNMEATITLGGTGYDYLFMGTREEANAAPVSEWIPAVVDENGQYTYRIPVAALDEPLTVASRSKRDGTAGLGLEAWYDRQITIASDSLELIPEENPETPVVPPSNPTNPSQPSQNTGTDTPTSNTPDLTPDTESKYDTDLNKSTSAVDNSTALADGVYTLDSFTYSGGTGRVKLSASKVTVKNGKAYLTLVFSSTTWSYVKANGNIYYGTVSGGSKSFVIPVALNKNNTIVGMTTAMSAAHEITYVIFPYLAAASSTAGNPNGGGVISTTNEKLDEEAPEIMGLEFESEVELKHAQNFKIFQYGDGISLLEIDITKDTARDPEKLAAEAAAHPEDAEAANKPEEAKKAAVSDEGEEVQPSQEEMAAELYKGNVVKYLIVPEDVEVPVGLEQEMILIQLPAEHGYVTSEDAEAFMDKLGVTDLIQAKGEKPEDLEETNLEDIIYAGDTLDPDFKTLVKAKCDYAILDTEILPRDPEENPVAEGPEEEPVLTVEEQIQRMEDITAHLSLLKMPVIIDRSAEEEDALAQLEWVKVYGLLFGKSAEAEKLFDQAVKAAQKS